MNIKTSVEVLKRLLDSFPKCCACDKDIAVVMNSERFWLCEKCFAIVPCSDYPPAHDLRIEVYAAMAVLAREAG